MRAGEAKRHDGSSNPDDAQGSDRRGGEPFRGARASRLGLRRPHRRGPPAGDHVDDGINLVLVGQNLLDDRETLAYQLTHEELHCLGSCRTSALEEGLATLFGLDNHLVPGERSVVERSRLDPARRRHLQDIETLLRMDPDIVKRLREPPIAFEAIEPGDFVGRGVPTSLTTKLCRPADRD